MPGSYRDRSSSAITPIEVNSSAPQPLPDAADAPHEGPFVFRAGFDSGDVLDALGALPASDRPALLARFLGRRRRDPSPEQIRQRCLRIRAGWSDRQEVGRRADRRYLKLALRVYRVAPLDPAADDAEGGAA